MNYATISADVVSYTSLTETDKRRLREGINKLLADLTERYTRHSFFGRLVQGDSIECAIDRPEYSLRIALLLKTFIKSIGSSDPNVRNSRSKFFAEHGIRLAVAVAPLSTFDPENGIMDGEAVYMSGRTIKNYSSAEKQKVIIKNTMFFCSPDEKLTERFDTMFSLLNTIISKCTVRQSEVVFYKLWDLSEKEISARINRAQSTISQHSTAAGWLGIEKAVNYFEKTIRCQ